MIKITARCQAFEIVETWPKDKAEKRLKMIREMYMHARKRGKAKGLFVKIENVVSLPSA